VPFENDDALDRRVDDLLVAIESILIFYGQRQEQRDVPI
jgi:hypothetical protein